MLRRVGASLIASLLLWLAALTAPASAAPHTPYGRELELASAFGARTICVDCTTLTLRVSTVERRVSPTRWSPGSPSSTQCVALSYVRVHDVVREHVRAHVPLALRRTYDAHAPPALSRVAESSQPGKPYCARRSRVRETHMSNQDDLDDTIGRSIEPWLVISLLSLVPLVTAVLLPEAWRMPLYVVGGALCIIGVALLVKQEVRRA